MCHLDFITKLLYNIYIAYVNSVYCEESINETSVCSAMIQQIPSATANSAPEVMPSQKINHKIQKEEPSLCEF